MGGRGLVALRTTLPLSLGGKGTVVSSGRRVGLGSEETRYLHHPSFGEESKNSGVVHGSGHMRDGDGVYRGCEDIISTGTTLRTRVWVVTEVRVPDP